MFWQRLFSNVFNYFMLHVNSCFCHLFMTSHLGSSVGAYRLVKSKFGVAQFISIDINNLLLCSKQIILEYLNWMPHWTKFDTHMGTKHTDPLPEDTPPNTWPDYLWHTQHTHFSQHIWFCVLGSGIKSHRTCKKDILKTLIFMTTINYYIKLPATRVTSEFL
jgi:hypothetical protein